jgi:hypothetical protein
MTRGLIKTGFSLLVLALFLIGLGTSLLRSQNIVQLRRSMDSQTRALSQEVHAVELTGPIELELRRGEKPSLTVRGEERLLGNVATTVDGDTLNIGIQGMLLHHRNPLRVVLVLPTLERVKIKGSRSATVTGFWGEQIELDLDGGGNLQFTGRYKDVRVGLNSGKMSVDTDNADLVTVEHSGSGHLTLAGRTQRLDVEQSGSGKLDAEHLTADDTTVELDGSGRASVFARTRAHITVNGSGNVEVYGNPPKRTVSSEGPGEVSFVH